MKIGITSSVFKLEKGYLYQNGVEFHKQFNGIGGATVAPRAATLHHGGATFLVGLQTIQQSSDKVVPPDTSMVC